MFRMTGTKLLTIIELLVLLEISAPLHNLTRRCKESEIGGPWWPFNMLSTTNQTTIKVLISSILLQEYNGVEVPYPTEKLDRS